MGTFNVDYHTELRIVECTATGFLTVDELLEAAIKTIALSGSRRLAYRR